jgi:hypothetical protein
LTIKKDAAALLTDFRVLFCMCTAADQPCLGGAVCCAAAAVDKLASPKEFFTACYHTLLCCPETSDSSASSSTSGSSNSGKITQQLCVKAMAAAYSAHAGTIGPFEGIPHLLQLLDNTQQRSLRHALLLFLQALIAPKAAGDLAALPPSSSTATTLPNVSGSVAAAAAMSQQQGQSNSIGSSSGKPSPSQQKTNAAQAAAVRAAKANGYLLMDHGGLQLLVDFVAGAHECTERRMAAAAAAGAGGAAGAGHLITSISHAEVRCLGNLISARIAGATAAVLAGICGERPLGWFLVPCCELSSRKTSVALASSSPASVMLT